MSPSNVVISDNGVKDPQPSEYVPEAHVYPRAVYKAEPTAKAGFRMLKAETPDDEAKLVASGYTADFSKVNPDVDENPLTAPVPATVPVASPVPEAVAVAPVPPIAPHI